MLFSLLGRCGGGGKLTTLQQAGRFRMQAEYPCHLGGERAVVCRYNGRGLPVRADVLRGELNSRCASWGKVMNLANLFQHESDLHALAAGETLFREGERGDVLFVLMSGVAEIRVNNKVVEVAEPGALLGEMTMIDEAARSATVVARTDCRLLAVDRRRFDFLIQNTPHFALHVMRVIARRLRRTDAEL